METKSSRGLRPFAIAGAVAVLSAHAPAHAQNAAPLAQAAASDIDSLKTELQAMQAQMARMQGQIADLEARLAQARTAGAGGQGSVPATASVAGPVSGPVSGPDAAPPTGPVVRWDGAPRMEAPASPQRAQAGNWSFKPRGRLQVDSAGVSAPAGQIPAGQSRTSLGWATEFRRAYLGVDGSLPGRFGYRIEADFAGSEVDLTDLYLTYNGIDHVTLTLGQHKPFWGFEEMTSDLHTSFMERAAFHGAFGFERRVGFSAQYQNKALLVQAGLFTDNARDLNNDSNNSFSLDGRTAVQPKLGKGQLHLGGSVHYRQFNDLTETARYRARPFVHTTDVRLVDTRAFGAKGERSFGLEAAWTQGRFHAAAESAWLTALRPGRADPTFHGGYAEVGLFLTNDTLPYKASDGGWNRIRPRAGLDKGGLGAVQVNLRYDWLDLNDAVIIGGQQEVAGLSLLWVPVDYVRFHLNYGRLWIDNGTAHYTADAVGMRAQFDF